MAPRKNPPPKRRKTMNASEALNTFFGYLTTRRLPLILSANHNAAPVAELIGAFCKLNNLPKVRDEMMVAKQPVELENLTNVEPPNMTQVAMDEPEVFSRVIGALDFLSHAQQNMVVGKLLARMKREREQVLDQREERHRNSFADERKASDNLRNLENIMAGNFTVI